MHDELDISESKLQAQTECVPINSLVVFDSPRTAGESTDHIGVLTQLKTGLPPIVVHRPTMRVIDGVHRLRAATFRGDDVIEVQFFGGSEADAFVLAVELNSAHGFPLSLADRLLAAERIVGSHPYWSDRRIARVAGVAPNTVGALRRRLTAQGEQSNGRVGVDGRVRPRSSAEGRQLAGELMRKHPDMSLREAAKAAGISPATALDVRARIKRGESPVPPRRQPNSRQQSGGQRRSRRMFVTERARPRPVVSADVVSNLTKDPSLRYTDAGRTMLRAFASCALNPEEWNRIIDAVPPHHLETVAHLARSCASMWLEFADQLAQREGSPTSVAKGSR